MAAVYVPLPRDVKDALLTLAEREDRDPRRQAARLLQEGLVRAGVLTDDRSTTLTTDSREPEAVAR